MDLTTAIIGMQQSKLVGEVQIRVARIILDTEQDQGNAAVKLIEAASSGINSSADAVSAATAGLGGQIRTAAIGFKDRRR